MSEVKVSIIVPVYNVENYLTTCLDSLINQTLKDIEIICINDGSTDKSLYILQSYVKKDSRIILIDKENEGQSIARNVGIEKASGEYLGFVDSDDWVDLDYFEKLYNTAKRYDSDIACAGFKRCKLKRERIKKIYKSEIVGLNINDKIRLDNVPRDNYIWNKIFKRDVWLKTKINFEPNRYFEDIALVIKILHKFEKLVTVPNIFYNYRLNLKSTVTQKTSKHIKDYFWAINTQREYAEENNICLDISNIIQKKIYYKFYNLTLLKIYYYEFHVDYKLFGIIPLIKKEIVI